MRVFLKIALLVINSISVIVILILGILGALSELLHPPTFEKLLANMNLAWLNNNFWKILIVCLIVLITASLIHKKFFGA